MARPERRPTRGATKAPARPTAQKPCPLCQDKVEWVDYKDVTLLRTHMSDRGKIRARHVTGNCARHQGEIAAAIKTARDLVLLPYGKDKTTDTTEPSPPLQMSGPTGGVHP